MATSSKELQQPRNAALDGSLVEDDTAEVIVKFSRQSSIAALQGQAIPEDLSHPLHRLCVVYGIRHHLGYGDSLRAVSPIFIRSLNARAIMSNVIPVFHNADEIPYCIWYPEVATEQTYRELLRRYNDRYPQLSYIVARACAVAGYQLLYEDLNVLPEVHVAEEAREMGNMDIYESVMSHEVKYSIMNDYTRKIDVSNRAVANLNGDTCACWMLKVKQGFDFPQDGHLDQSTGAFVGWPGYFDTYFNLTEDMNISEIAVDDVHTTRSSPERMEVQLLSEPLPAQLPTVQKDLLIAMAAYNGDIDRYVRLRRPMDVKAEEYCRIHGILCNTAFALWWRKQPMPLPDRVQEAINARMIMNNILVEAPFPVEDIPYNIWWPDVADESTYRHLARIQPEMLPQILHACIKGDYQELFDELLPDLTPDRGHLDIANTAWNQYFRKALDDRLGVLKAPAADPGYAYRGRWTGSGRVRTDNYITQRLDNGNISTSENWPGLGRSCDASAVDLEMSLPETWRMTRDDPITGNGRHLNYEDWPPNPPQRLPGSDDEVSV